MLIEAGKEWVVDATGCEPSSLRDLPRLQDIVALLVSELGLSVVGTPQWHVFPGEAGVTGLLLLAESHVALHTFPELGLATFNLYCCRPRAPWPWQQRLSSLLGAKVVTVRSFDRGEAARTTPVQTALPGETTLPGETNVAVVTDSEGT